MVAEDPSVTRLPQGSILNGTITLDHANGRFDFLLRDLWGFQGTDQVIHFGHLIHAGDDGGYSIGL